MKQLAVLIFMVFGLMLNAQSLSFGEDSIDVQKYVINIDTLNITTKQIYAYTDVYFTPKINNLRNIPLDLLKLSVDSVFFNSIKISTWSYNDTLLMIKSPFFINSSDIHCVRVYYHGNPVIDPSTWGGFYFQSPFIYNIGVGFKDVPHNYGRVWFPCIDNFEDKAIYEFNILTNTDQMAVCGGILTDNLYLPALDKKLWKWKMSEPISTYLASFAVAPYVCTADTFDGANGKISVDIFTTSAYSSKVAGSFVNIKNMLSFFESRFGPYMWERVGYVGVPFNAGAMEHATNIAFPNLCITGNTTFESLIYHELSHHWFGNLVTCATAEEMWINEGWASFCEFLTTENLKGEAAMQNHVRDEIANVLQKANIDDGGFFPVGNVPSNITYGTTVYRKGALAVHTLRNYLGDSLFFSSVRKLLDLYKYETISNTQLQVALSEASGVDLKDFFDAWILRKGFLHFDVDSMCSVPAEDGFYTTVFLRQKLYEAEEFAQSNQVELSFIGNNGNIFNSVAKFSGESGSSVIKTPFEPVAVFVDMNDKTADAVVGYNKIVKASGNIACSKAFLDVIVNEAPDSFLIRAEHHKVAPDPIVSDENIVKISSSHYWRICAVLPTSANISLIFNYQKTDFLDADLLVSADVRDSLVMLYRRGAGDKWRIVPFTRTGSLVSGKFTVNNAMTGEYAIGVGNAALGLSDFGSLPKLYVYPNPAKHEIFCDNISNYCNAIKIIDINGKAVCIVKVASDKITIPIMHLKSGIYFVSEVDAIGRFISQSKIVIEK